MLVTLMLLFWISSAIGKTRTIKLGTIAKPGSPNYIASEKFKRLVEERSGQTCKVELFHSGSFGNEVQILNLLQTGTIHIAVATTGSFDNFDPMVRVINFPFLFKDHAQAYEILDGPIGQQILKSLESSGFKGLCFSENGFRHLTNNVRPVIHPDDLKGLKIRVMVSEIHKAVWKGLGAIPVPLPWPIDKELKQGVVDGEENPLSIIEVYKFYESQKYLSLTKHVYSPHIDVACLSWFNQLSGEEQNMITTAMKDAATYQRKLSREQNAERLVFLKEKGMQITMAVDVDAFRKKAAAKEVIEQYSDPKVRALLFDILKAVK